MSAARPEIGAWYQTVEGTYLEVVALDLEDGTMEVQFYDGAVEEYDSESDDDSDASMEDRVWGCSWPSTRSRAASTSRCRCSAS